ncbi:MAG: branched-chain amino acid transaminase [Porticoccaceae bacterium]|jgi:branched-chain amino acid aminotransferase|nr:branched-chain amino acid transaminase [Porticoccaceae bacterium]MBT4590401.1 branched-chain amino acid transaminase [Porticoccaceae bacterium]
MSFADRDGFIWMDGKLIDWRDAQVHFLTSSLHYGNAVFEGIRAYQTENSGTCVFRLEDHIKRLFNSAKIIHMTIPYSQEEICAAHREIVRVNNLDAAYIRPLVFLGSEGMGLRAESLEIHLGIAAWDWPSYMAPETLALGLKVRTSSYTRHHVNITMVKAKASANYLNSSLALREALDSGCDEAIMLDPEGYVSEGSAENFFMVRDGVIYTPDLTSCLDGITRDTVFKLAADKGIEVREKRISRDEVYIADEAFFTGTAAEIAPIREYDSRIIGDGKRGPVAAALQTAYSDLVQGKNTKYQDWLSPVAE